MSEMLDRFLTFRKLMSAIPFNTNMSVLTPHLIRTCRMLAEMKIRNTPKFNRLDMSGNAGLYGTCLEMEEA